MYRHGITRPFPTADRCLLRRLLDRSSRCCSFGEKKTANSGYFPRYMTNDGVVLPHGDSKWIVIVVQGGLIFEGKCIFDTVLDSPTLQLSDIACKVEEMSGTVVSTSTLCRLLATYEVTRKKVQHVALQRCLDLRASSVASAFTFSKEMFVWVDETGSNMLKILYGYAPYGERATSPRLLVQGQQISAISVMSTEGIVATELTESGSRGF